VEDAPRKQVGYSLIHSRGAPLAVAHCRFFIKQGKRHIAALYPERSPRVEVRHCEFAGAFGGAIAWWNLTASHELEVSDCVSCGVGHFVYYDQAPSARAIKLRMYRNTFVGHCAIQHYYLRLPEPPDNPDLRPFRIEARGNVLDTAIVFSLTLHGAGSFQPEVDQPLLARCLAWNESKNLYAGSRALLNLSQNPGKYVDAIKALREWQAYWGLKDTGCLLGPPRYQGGNAAALWAAQDRVTAADFRLHPDSPGKGAGEAGRDLGADVDKVGPGPAYEAWKKTSSYQQWLKDNTAVK
jgi:hypothetical protein